MLIIINKSTFFDLLVVLEVLDDVSFFLLYIGLAINLTSANVCKR